MNVIEWDDAFSVGVVRLDADHRLLMAMINQLCEAWQAGKDGLVLDKLFDALLVYADVHFTREETVLAALGYDRLDEQRKAHAALKAEVLAFRDRHLAAAQPEALTAETAQFLRSWLLDHILGEDRKYKSLFG